MKNPAPIFGGSRRVRQSLRSPEGQSNIIGPIYTPEGRVIASVIEEGAERVLRRRVGERERFRRLDGWSLGEKAAEQAKILGVSRLRYQAPEGRYEMPFSTFLERARRLPFEHEAQYVLPRRAWVFTPAGEGSRQMTLAGL